jgi:Histone RNA hairpin-binding protein RNA-binding domain
MLAISPNSDTKFCNAAFLIKCMDSGPGKQVQEIKLDEVKLAWRQKQIDYGKNTLGYQRYIKAVPK